MPRVESVIIPSCVCTDRSDPNFWPPPIGTRLVVYCDGRRLRDVVSADCAEGWAMTYDVIELPGGTRRIHRAADGEPYFRRYTGRVTFDLESADDRLPYTPIDRGMIERGEV